jgi:hypothetical protein
MFEEVALIMRRLVVVLTIALVMAAMMLAMAMPAFADHSLGHTYGQANKEGQNKELTAFCREQQTRPGVSECAPGGGNAQGPK